MLELDPRSHPAFPALSAHVTREALLRLDQARTAHPSFNPLHLLTSSFTLVFLSNTVSFLDPIWSSCSYDLLLSRLYTAYVAAALVHLDLRSPSHTS